MDGIDTRMVNVLMQEDIVSNNDRSIIEAYTTIEGNCYVNPFGIYENDTPIGFERDDEK